MPDYLAGVLIGVALGIAILMIAGLGIAKAKYDRRSIQLQYWLDSSLFASAVLRDRRRM